MEIMLNSILDNIKLVKIEMSSDLFSYFNSSYTRVGFMWDNQNIGMPFGNTKLVINDYEYIYFTKEFYDFITLYFKPVIIDLITCDLVSPIFKDEISKLKQLLPNVQIEYSINKTGSSIDADWIMESNNMSIKDIYFNSNIESYNFSLGGGSQSNHTIIIRNDGNAYACGNNLTGQLGVANPPATRAAILPMTINPVYPLPVGTTATYASCGNDFSAVLYENSLLSTNFVYTCGDYSQGQLGRTAPFPPNESYLLAPVDTSSVTETYPGAQPIAVSCGSRHMAIIFRASDDSTHVFTCGYNVVGQLGNGSTINSSTLVEMNTTNVPSGYNPIQVACGSLFTIVLFENASGNRTILGCGTNVFGQLGTGSTGGAFTILTSMSSISNVLTAHPNAKPSYIACGGQHTIVIFDDTVTTTSAYVYVCGSNSNGQLGIPSILITGTLSEIDLSPIIGGTYSSTTKPVRVSAGDSHTAVLFVDPIAQQTPLYLCGLNSSGQLGDGTTIDRTTLTQMQYTFSLSTTQILAVTTGAQHTIILTHQNTIDFPIYGVGSNSFLQLGKATGTSYTTIVSPDAPYNYTDVIDIFDTIPITPADVCFNYNTKILCLVENKEVYVPIQNIRKGDLVKTYKHGYIPVDLIGKKSMINNPKMDSCMYIMYKTDDMVDDLIVTKNHAILVDKVDNEIQKEFEIIDGKYLVLASKSSKFEKIYDRKIYTYYHLVLKDDCVDLNESNRKRYGIYANGVLTETVSRLVFQRMNFTLL
jgi:alpha-tubulin suppressor-like RCC1 family protein